MDVIGLHLYRILVSGAMLLDSQIPDFQVSRSWIDWDHGQSMSKMLDQAHARRSKAQSRNHKMAEEKALHRRQEAYKEEAERRWKSAKHVLDTPDATAGIGIGLEQIARGKREIQGCSTVVPWNLQRL